MTLPILDAIATSPNPVASRFWTGVEQRGPDECWPWKRYRDRWGYGTTSINSRLYIASRVAWALSRQSDPGDLLVCHTCDNPACCNPNHLWLGSNNDNMRDMAAKGRRAGKGRGPRAIRTHCRNGHEYTPENTYRKPSRVGRVCRTCLRARYTVKARSAA